MGYLIMNRICLLLLLVLGVNNLFGQIPNDGLSLWLRADRGIISIGSNVVSWEDQSANKFNALTKTTQYPQLIAQALNGLPIIRFNGLNNGMETPLFSSFPGKRGTIAVVVKINGRSTTSGVGVGNLVSTFHGHGVIWQFCASPGKYSFFDGKGAEGFPVSTSVSSEWSIATIMRTDDTSMQVYGGGRYEQSISICNNQPDLNALKIGFNGRLGGTATDSIPEVFNGDIAEIIIYSRQLSGTELTAVHGYLSKKYRLALTPPPFWERWWFYVLVALLVASAVIMVAQYFKGRKLRKQLAELEREQQLDKERQRISREMHDDIGAGLTQITMMSVSAQNKLGAEGGKELQDIAETSRQLVSSMSEIIWCLNPENRMLDQLIAYLREQLNKQLEYSGINYSVLLPDDANAVILSNEKKRNILLVTKEIVNNAIKYSKAGNITVKMSVGKNVLIFSIEDDGVGFDVDKAYAGNGLKNIRQRLAEIDAVLNIKSEKNNGSSFCYSIPV